VCLASCGSDNGSSSATGSDLETYDVEASTTMTVAKPAIEKAQFLRRMNKICRKAWVTVHKNWDSHTSQQDRQLSADERFDEAVRLSLLAGIDFYIFDNFRIIGSPPGEERAIEKIIGPFQAAVELGWHERWRARSIADIESQFTPYNRRASRYGLDDCLVDEAHLRPIEA
jgi:hypothetical protein